MALELRRVAAAELPALATALEVAAGRMPSAERVGEAQAEMADCTMSAAFEDGQVVAGTGFEELELTTPGPVTVPAARIMLTAVVPTHRRRGLALALMAAQLPLLIERRIPLAMFTTSGPGIYERIGYSPATFTSAVELDARPRAVVEAKGDPDGPGALRFVDAQERARLLPELFDAHRRRQPGQVLRTDKFWRAWFADRELYRPDAAGGRFVLVHQGAAGEPSGYVSYRLVAGPLRERPVRMLVVEDLIALDDVARRALWAWCASFDQAELVLAANVALDDPLRRLLRDPRAMRISQVRDFLWLRLVDVAAALEARRYAVETELVIDVIDGCCPANNGRFRLETAAGGGARCTPSRATPDLTLDVAALAAAYLGATTFTTLARAGRLTADDVALPNADVCFSCHPGPWTVTDW